MQEVTKSAIRRIVITVVLALLLAVIMLLILTNRASSAQLARGNPVRTETLAAGPYLVDVNLYDEPHTDTPFAVTVVPHDTSLRLTGSMMAIPSSEIDATKLPATLTPDAAQPWILTGSLRLPVRGAWTLSFTLSGPQGSATTTLITDVAAPGAMPTWLAWSIGILPVIGIAVWFLLQHRYRRALQDPNRVRVVRG